MPRSVVACLTVLLLFLGVTLAAPLRGAWVLATGVTATASATESRFASVTPQAKHAVVCACVACPGLQPGGKCCCTGAVTTGEGYALRTVCDTAPDASAPVSPLPPVPLSQGIAASLPRFAPVLCAGLLSAPRHDFVPRSPLPPDAPPRFVS